MRRNGVLKNPSNVFYSKPVVMNVECNTQKKSISGLKSSKRTFAFNGKNPQTEQIDGHRVGLSRRVARGLAHELISYGQNHEKMSHFGYWYFKGHGVFLFHCISKP
jgi:hypothetical protein